MANMTDKQYNAKLNGFITSSLNQRDNCQVLIVEGIRQYIDCGRTTRLSEFLARSVAVKSIPTVTIKDFIKEHTNLKYAKNKAGEYMFLKDSTSTNENKLPEINWYDWNKAKHNNVKEVDYVKRLANDVKNARAKGVQTSQMLEAMLAGGLSASELMKALDNLNNLKLKAIAA